MYLLPTSTFEATMTIIRLACILVTIGSEGCASPPKAVPARDSSTPYDIAHKQCSAEMHRGNSAGPNQGSSYATGAITANVMSMFSHMFQADSMGYDVYRGCMFRNGWRLEKD